MSRSTFRVLAAAGVAAIAMGVAPVLSSARSIPAKRTITFQEPTPRLVEDDIPPKSKTTVSLGDRLAIGGLLETPSHQRLGTFGGSCIVVGAGSSLVTTPLVCQAVYRIAAGQIEAMGMMTLSKTNLAIVGGTGAYEGAIGFVSPGRVAKGFSDADELTIDSGPNS